MFSCLLKVISYLAMPPKRKAEAGGAGLRKRRSISMEIKVDVIKRSEKGERLLVLWLDDQHHRNVPVSRNIVMEKARCLFNDLKAVRIASEGQCDEEFGASRGWFTRFKERANIHNIKVLSPASSPYNL